MKRAKPYSGEDEEEGGGMWRRPQGAAGWWTMELQVRMLDGSSFKLNVTPWTTILQLKKMIADRKGCLMSEQSLSINGKFCTDNTHQISRYTNTHPFVVDLVISTAAIGSSSSSSGLTGPVAAAAAPPPQQQDNAGDDDSDDDNRALLDLIEAHRRHANGGDDDDEGEESEEEVGDGNHDVVSGRPADGS